MFQTYRALQTSIATNNISELASIQSPSFNGPNCWGLAAFSLGKISTFRHMSEPEFSSYLKECQVISSDKVSRGDMVVFLRKTYNADQIEPTHAGIMLDKDTVFEKSGANKLDKVGVFSFNEVIKRNESIFDDGLPRELPSGGNFPPATKSYIFVKPPIVTEPTPMSDVEQHLDTLLSDNFNKTKIDIDKIDESIKSLISDISANCGKITSKNLSIVQTLISLMDTHIENSTKLSSEIKNLKGQEKIEAIKYIRIADRLFERRESLYSIQHEYLSQNGIKSDKVIESPSNAFARSLQIP